MTDEQIEKAMLNDLEAHAVLGLIVAEFLSDPMSVQCFDLRVVERAKACVATRKIVEKTLPFVL